MMINVVEQENKRATIGDNLPPFMRAEQSIKDLYAEASLWLDGAKVSDQQTADGLAKLLNMIRQAEKDADKARAEEKKPHLEAGKAVDAQYKPILDMAARASDACKRALAPWLAEQERAKREEAERLRKEAEKKADEASKAIQSANRENLAEIEKAEAAISDAKSASIAAKVAEKNSTAKASSDVGRAVSLRTFWDANLINPTEAMRHIWERYPDDVRDFMQSVADRSIRQGVRQFPGFEIVERKEVV